ncbi:MAG TPA: M42 family peptidase, partial [Bacillota bacterium]|nr:M42 family peptidase [Bacillota bacterium]
MFDLIKDIMKPLGVSGREGPVRDVIKEKIAPYVDEITIDALGNLIAHKKGAPGAKKLMFAAHMDEIGFFTTCIDDGGRIRYSNAGGIRFAETVYSHVVFENGVRGVLVADDDAKEFNIKNGFVDIGAKNKK